MYTEKLYKQFPDVHPNIVLKTEIIRKGIDVSREALDDFQNRNDLLWKGFHLFSYDWEKTKVYGDKVPWYGHLEDGCFFMIRTNEKSPYMLDKEGSEFIIRERESKEIIARKIWFERKPRWYDMKTKNGIQMGAIVQGQGRMLFTTMNKFCELWNSGNQCLFCNINVTLHDQKSGGEDVVARIEPEEIADSVKTALEVDPHYSILYITGGTILKKYKGQTELEFYTTRLNALKEKLQVWIPTCVQIAPYDNNGWKKLREIGFGSVEPNIEVWGKELFEWICPGKNKFIGFDEWIKRTINAVDFWGPGRVNPNFVLGVEMAKPHGFTEVASAIKSTTGGWDYLMRHGVLPRFNLWTQEAGSAFEGHGQPPLEFFIEAQKAYTELRWKHNFDPPYPATMYNNCYGLNSLQDFEYYHGTGTTSKKNLDERLGVKEGEPGGYYDQEGYTLGQ